MMTGWLSDSFFLPLNEYTAILSCFFLNSFGIKTAVNGVYLTLPGFNVKIITECSALFLIILYGCFVVSYPAPLKTKLYGLLIGSPVLFGINVLRIVLVSLSGMRSPELFEYVHVYLGQVMMIGLVVIVCMMWLRISVMVETKDTTFLFIVRVVICTILLFFIWLYLHKVYVEMNGQIAQYIFSLFHYNFAVATDLPVYPNTFNIILFTALVLATLSVSWEKKGFALVIGLFFLASTDILFRICNIMYFVFKSPVALKSAIFLKIINQYFFPVALWLILVRTSYFRNRLYASVARDTVKMPET